MHHIMQICMNAGPGVEISYRQLASRPVTQTGANVRTARVVAAVAGLLGTLLAILTPFLPVKQTTAELNWPQGDTL